MKLLAILFLSFSIPNSNYNLAALRNLYEGAAVDETKAQELITVSKPYLNIHTARGYYGAGKIIMAKYYYNPYSKLKTFNEGKGFLEAAIKADYANAELRFLRLSIQKNVPSLLGYNNNIEDDKKYLNNCLPLLNDKQLKSMITNYLKTI